MTLEIRCAVEARNELGEGPIWNPHEQALYWCDIRRPAIWRLRPDTGEVSSWALPVEISSLVFRERGGICASLGSGFAFVEIHGDHVHLQPVVNPEPDQPGNRLNDGKCDRRGRYWCGTMDRGYAPGRGSLWRLDADLSCHRMEEGITVSNGLAFSPDNRVLYFADTRADTVWAYDFEIDSGRTSNRRVFISTEGSAGKVDGATVDADGNYWCAHIRGGAIACYDPRGALQRTIALPTRYPTMCTFGGPGLDVLYVTSGTTFLQPGEAAQQPLAGGLFALHGTGARGLPEPFFAG